jgi:hypothetical protein
VANPPGAQFVQRFLFDLTLLGEELLQEFDVRIRTAQHIGDGLHRLSVALRIRAI